MKFYIFLFFIFTIKIISKEKGKNYAVLVAGSNDYINYRHQADVFHLYHILLEKGFEKENIIVFAYDDIVNNNKNPFKGKIFNDQTGRNYYENINIDYRKNNVNIENYLNVLLGNENDKLKKVLNTNSNDNILLYFSDHGSENFIVFPNFDFLYSDKLIETFIKMKKNNKYNKLIFYLEACHSASMFNNLPDYLNIYAITAANFNESSYAYFCFPNDKINGVSIGSCLGDEFSHNFFKSFYQHFNSKKFTFHQHFLDIKSNTKKSSVMEFGNKNLSDENINDVFYMNNKKKDVKLFYFFRNKDNKVNINRIKSTNVKLKYLEIKASYTNDIKAIIEYNEELRLTKKIKERFERFKSIILTLNKEKKNERKIDFDCLRFSNEIYREKCGIEERDIEFLSTFSNICSIYNLNYLDLYKTINSICQK